MGRVSGETTLSNSAIYIFASFSMGSTLKGKNLLLMEQIHSFKSIPHFERATCPRKSEKLFPLVKWQKKT